MLLQVATATLHTSHLQVRGKTVYLQYSTRDQIINSTARTGEASGNVILVSLENLDVRR